ncbi:MAG: hypothetical protein LBC72_00750, partial [Spirochaetaceae bacterium]|nr:hypothetical protein [Spirochaetaceae bacterium]
NRPKRFLTPCAAVFGLIVALAACNQPIQRAKGTDGGDAANDGTALAYLAIETDFSAAPGIAPQMDNGTATVLAHRKETANPEKSYFVMYPDAAGGDVRVILRPKPGVTIGRVSVNGENLSVVSDDAAANEGDLDDGEGEEPDGEDDGEEPEEPAEAPTLTYAFTVGTVGYTVLKITVIDGDSGESADYVITLQPAGTAGGTGLQDQVDQLYNDLYNTPDGDILFLKDGLSTQAANLVALSGRLDTLQLDAQEALLTQAAVLGGGPSWQADISGAAFIYIKFSGIPRFYPVLKANLGAPLALSGGTASFSLADDTLTITASGATLEALYTGTNSADYQSLALLKQQFDLLDAALAATYLTAADLGDELDDYYTKAAADSTFATQTALSGYLQSSAMGAYTSATAINNAIATAINDALGWSPGDTVQAKITALDTALTASLGDVSTALSSLTTRVAALEGVNGAAFVLEGAAAAIIQATGFAGTSETADITALNDYFKNGKRYYHALANVSSAAWTNMPVTGADVTGTLEFVRAGDILTVVFVVSCVDAVYQYREYRGMWLLNANLFTWQNPAGATAGWIPTVTGGGAGQLSVGVTTWDSGELTNGRVIARKTVNVVTVGVKKNGGSGTNLGTLPEQFRPPETIRCAMAYGNGENPQSRRFNISTSGAVTLGLSSDETSDFFYTTYVVPNPDPLHVLSVEGLSYSFSFTNTAAINAAGGTIAITLPRTMANTDYTVSYETQIWGEYAVQQKTTTGFNLHARNLAADIGTGKIRFTVTYTQTGGAYVIKNPVKITGVGAAVNTRYYYKMGTLTLPADRATTAVFCIWGSLKAVRSTSSNEGSTSAHGNFALKWNDGGSFNSGSYSELNGYGVGVVPSGNIDTARTFEVWIRESSSKYMSAFELTLESYAATSGVRDIEQSMFVKNTDTTNWSRTDSTPAGVVGPNM